MTASIQPVKAYFDSVLLEALARKKVREAKTISTSLLAFRAELGEKYGLSFLDSLTAASVLALDREVVSGDEAFDRVAGLKRKPISAR